MLEKEYFSAGEGKEEGGEVREKLYMNSNQR